MGLLNFFTYRFEKTKQYFKFGFQKRFCCVLHKNSKNVIFPHPVGITIHKLAVFSPNVTVYQGVSIVAKYAHVPNYCWIERNVVIGANVTIVGNVRIGEGSVIGAGSVVTKNVSNFSVIVGNPARKIKKK